MAQELFVALQSDHDEIKGLIEDLLDTPCEAGKTRSVGLAKVRKELISHFEAEESACFAALIKVSVETKETALRGLEEHRVARFILEGLVELDVSDERWIPMAEVLWNFVESHFENEESEVFDAYENLSDEELAGLYRQFEAAKATAKAALNA